MCEPVCVSVCTSVLLCVCLRKSVPLEARGHSLSASILTEESLGWARRITVVRAVPAGPGSTGLRHHSQEHNKAGHREGKETGA